MRALVVVCLAAAILPLLRGTHPIVRNSTPAPPWPEPFRNMREQPLTGTETRFAAEAGTSVARFTGNGRDWVLRWIPNASRRIHPAEECYRAAGWRVHPLPMRFIVPSDGSFASARWGCFEAQRGTIGAEVCQTIIDGSDRSWSDVGSWWWAAIFHRTPAPWLAVEMITALPKSRSSDEVQSGTGLLPARH